MSILRKQSHFYAAIASIVLFIGEIFLAAWALKTTDAGWSFNPKTMNASALALFCIAMIIVTTGFLSSIFFGVWQIKEDLHSEREYAGWMSIFVPYLIFTIFVNYTMWRRSGLTNKQFKDGVKKYNIEHVEEIVDMLNKEDKFPKSLEVAFGELKELRELKLLSEYGVHAYMYKLLFNELTLDGIPVIYKKQEIFDLEVYK